MSDNELSQIMNDIGAGMDRHAGAVMYHTDAMVKNRLPKLEQETDPVILEDARQQMIGMAAGDTRIINYRGRKIKVSLIEYEIDKFEKQIITIRCDEVTE